MDEKIENPEKIVQFWVESSHQNYETMQHLMQSKDFNWALFLGHLVIEKLLKAYYVKKHQKHPLFTHDLLRLAKKTEIDLTGEQEEWLDGITTFNLNTRYDNYKQEFKTRCTLEFTNTLDKKYRNDTSMVNQSIIETAERFANQLPAELMVKKAYIFGSYAKGVEREESDIDIAVVLGNMTDFFDAQMQLMSIRRKVDLRIEPHPISETDFNATNPFALEIQNTGIEITLHYNNQIASEPTAAYGEEE